MKILLSHLIILVSKHSHFGLQQSQLNQSVYNPYINPSTEVFFKGSIEGSSSIFGHKTHAVSHTLQDPLPAPLACCSWCVACPGRSVPDHQRPDPLRVHLRLILVGLNMLISPQVGTLGPFFYSYIATYCHLPSGTAPPSVSWNDPDFDALWDMGSNKPLPASSGTLGMALLWWKGGQAQQPPSSRGYITYHHEGVMPHH